MNVFKKALLGLSFITACGISATASAVVITDSVNSNPDTAITFSTPYTFIHNVVNDGFVVGVDTITEATLTIRLTDATSNEQYQFLIGTGQTSPSYSNVANNTVDTDGGTTQSLLLNTFSIADLNADGLLSVTVKSLANNDNFFFASSSLAATVTKGVVTDPNAPANVPEPATVALLGLGLLSVAASRRKSANSKHA